jgi:hypothetical protein
MNDPGAGEAEVRSPASGAFSRRNILLHGARGRTIMDFNIVTWPPNAILRAFATANEDLPVITEWGSLA